MLACVLATLTIVNCHAPLPRMQGPKVMQMYIGSRRDGTPSATSPPAPTDAGVLLEAAGGELVAVLQFDGFITPATAEDARRRLINALQAGECKVLVVFASVAC